MQKLTSDDFIYPRSWITRLFLEFVGSLNRSLMSDCLMTFNCFLLVSSTCLFGLWDLSFCSFFWVFLSGLCDRFSSSFWSFWSLRSFWFVTCAHSPHRKAWYPSCTHLKATGGRSSRSWWAAFPKRWRCHCSALCFHSPSGCWSFSSTGDPLWAGTGSPGSPGLSGASRYPLKGKYDLIQMHSSWFYLYNYLFPLGFYSLDKKNKAGFKCWFSPLI